MQISCTPEVFKGVGIRTSIFWAKSEGLKLLLITTLTSSLVRPTSLTSGITRKGNEMSFVVRYLETDNKTVKIAFFRELLDEEH